MPSNNRCGGNVGSYVVVDGQMRSTGRSGNRRFDTEVLAMAAAKRMLDSGDETNPVFVAKLLSKVEAPQSHRVTRLI